MRGQDDPQSFDTLTIHSEIPVTKTRRRTNGDGITLWTQVQFEIVDKTEHGAAAFGVQVIIRFRHDLRSRQT